MRPRPIRRIAQWLRDYDPHLEIHWSHVVSCWVIERHTRVNEKLLAAFKDRLDISHNISAKGTEPAERIHHARLLARMEVEAMERGNRWLFAVPEPINEAALHALIVESDTWKEGSPEHDGAAKALKKYTDPIREQQAAERRKKLKSVQEHYRYKLRDYAPHFFRRLGLRTSVPGLRKDAHGDGARPA